LVVACLYTTSSYQISEADLSSALELSFTGMSKINMESETLETLRRDSINCEGLSHTANELARKITTLTDTRTDLESTIKRLQAEYTEIAEKLATLTKETEIKIRGLDNNILTLKWIRARTVELRESNNRANLIVIIDRMLAAADEQRSKLVSSLSDLTTQKDKKSVELIETTNLRKTTVESIDILIEQVKTINIQISICKKRGNCQAELNQMQQLLEDLIAKEEEARKKVEAQKLKIEDLRKGLVTITQQSKTDITLVEEKKTQCTTISVKLNKQKEQDQSYADLVRKMIARSGELDTSEQKGNIQTLLKQILEGINGDDSKVTIADFDHCETEITRLTKISEISSRSVVHQKVQLEDEEKILQTLIDSYKTSIQAREVGELAVKTKKVNVKRLDSKTLF